MWRILKTEVSYTRDALVLAYAIALIFFVLALVREDYGFYNFMGSTTTVYFILMGILGNGAKNEKRYRYQTTLPVTLHDLAMADALYVLLVQAGMCVLWILFLVLRPGAATTEALWAMLATNATILSMITIFGIHYHLGFFGTKKYKRLNWTLLVAVLLTVAGLAYFGKLEMVAALIWRHYASGLGALLSVVSWLLLSLLSREVFVHRKSYLA